MYRLPRSRVWIGVLLLALLVVANGQSVPTAWAWLTPKKLNGVPSNVFRPKIAGESNRFHLIFQSQNDKALYYMRGTTGADATVNWESPRRIIRGIDNGQNDWDIIADASGTIHIGYASDGQVRYIRNTQGGNGGWSSPETVAVLENRLNALNITLDAARVPYIAWGEGVDPSALHFAYQAGSGWRQRSTNRANIIRNPRIVVSGGGDNALVHIVYENKRRGSDRNFIIGYTRGTRTGNLSNSNFSGSFGEPNGALMPNIALDPSDGTLYALYSSGTVNAGYDVTFSRSTNGGQNWSSASRVSLGTNNWISAERNTPIIADRGSAYMLLPVKVWDGDGYVASGMYDVRFDLRSNRFSQPVAVLDTRGTDRRNVAPTYAINGLAKVAVWVTGYIDGLAFNSDPGGIASGPLPTAPTGELEINNRAAVTNNSTLDLRIRSVRGSPTQMRVAIDADITPETPLQPFQSRFALPLPPSAACERSVAVQLVNDIGLESPVLRGRIKVDLAVQAEMLMRNPFMPGTAGLFPALGGGQQLVADGDPAYTRVPAMYTRIKANGECAGLRQLQVGKDEANLGVPYTIANDIFNDPVALPEPLMVGPNSGVVQVEDQAGNTLTQPWAITYDPVRPTLAVSGTLAVITPTVGANVVARLVFTGTLVQDNLYPGRGFWGVWIANSRTPIDDPVNDPGLKWTAAAVPGAESDFSLTWSLLTGITPAEQTPGSYYVYVRFLDGAGNATSRALSSSVTLTEIQRPTLWFPLAVK